MTTLSLSRPSTFEPRELQSIEDTGLGAHQPAMAQLVLDYCAQRGIEPRCCHPRDVVEQVIHAAEYFEVPPMLSADLLDTACQNDFVSL